MPEGIEVELYRLAAEAVVGRVVRGVDLPDRSYLRGADAGLDSGTLRGALVGERVRAARRRGKLLILDIGESALGLRFGMTGRLIVNGHAPIGELEYASRRDDPAWDRFRLGFDNDETLVIRDQRRLGSVELDPDEAALGVDLFEVDAGSLRQILSTSGRPLKARLMDQGVLAGLGNLLTDEILWRASLDPRRSADSLSTADLRRLLHHLQRVPAQLLQRGGSHMGDLQSERGPHGRCPRDGVELQKHTVGGRTSYACPVHQR